MLTDELDIFSCAFSESKEDSEESLGVDSFEYETRGVNTEGNETRCRWTGKRARPLRRRIIETPMPRLQSRLSRQAGSFWVQMQALALRQAHAHGSGFTQAAVCGFIYGWSSLHKETSTFDLYANYLHILERLVRLIHPDVLNCMHNFTSMNHPAKDCVLVVEPRSYRCGDEEL